MTSKSTKNARDKRVPLYTLDDAIAVATMTFPADDAIVRFVDARSYCPLADMTALVAALPADQRGTRRFIVGTGDITDRSTGSVVSHYTTVEMVLSNIAETSKRTGYVKHDGAVFLLAVQSIEFLRNTACLGNMQRARPVTLDENGMKFENA